LCAWTGELSELPPWQKPGSFSLDNMLEMLQQSGGK